MTIDRRLTRLALDRRLFRPVAEVAAAPVQLKSAADVLAVLAEQVAAVRADAEAGRLEKARVVGALAAVALRAVETGDLEVRIEMLEAVLKQREGPSKR
jgi:hypothetical protein